MPLPLFLRPAVRAGAHCLLLCLLGAGAARALAGDGALPLPVADALRRAALPPDAVALLVTEASPGAHTPARLRHRVELPMQPASVMKLVTTFAALDTLGPAYTWGTPIFLDGTRSDSTLHGTVYIQGHGDPSLVLERLWLLLRRLQGLGVRTIDGDIVLDHSAFERVAADPALFDGEPLRPYNAAPDALLLNYKAVLLTFTPDPASGVARVQMDPPLAGVTVPGSVPLTGAASASGTASGPASKAASASAECGDYRSALRADFQNPERIALAGRYPAACGEKVWPVAYADPPGFAARAVLGLWQDMGGALTGEVREGSVPPALLQDGPAFIFHSPPLADVLRDINKYSNNVMAQQLFLTLGGGSFAGARSALQQWWSARMAGSEAPLLENGSGLSRQERISALALARLLQSAYRSPFAPELMASLPIGGVDGTLRRAQLQNGTSAHLKTGTLTGVLARAGYVQGASGRMYVLVALFNHGNANTPAARAAMDSITDWVAQDTPAP